MLGASRASKRAATCVAAFLLVAGGARAQDEQRPLGAIDFFGFKGLNTEAVRAALPLRPGEPLPSRIEAVDLQERIASAVRQSTGRDPTDVAFVCCDTRQQWLLFVGLPGASSRALTYNMFPTSSVRLAPEAIRLEAEMTKAFAAAIGAGNAGEDDSQGFALSSEETARSKQLAVRDYALANEPLVRRVLEQSSDARHRAVAAAILGYAQASAGQIAALVRASRDPNDGVRNNAVRALGVLARGRKDLVPLIDARPFVQFVRSGTWSDRNKGAALLSVMTEKRDPRVLQMLRAEAFDALVEMARWRSTGHAFDARMLLGRMAGMDEQRVRQLAQAGGADDIDAIIGAATRK